MPVCEFKHSLRKWCVFPSEPFLIVFTWAGQSEPVQDLGPESERVALRPSPVLGPQRCRGSHLRVTVPIFLLHRCLLCRLCRLTGGYTTGNLCARNRRRWHFENVADKRGRLTCNCRHCCGLATIILSVLVQGNKYNARWYVKKQVYRLMPPLRIGCA